MKVLGLVASPRKLGNSEILAKEMLASLPDEVEKMMIRLTDLDIKQCSACYACLPEDKDCVIKDDLGFLLEQIKAVDAVIIATPCYFLGTHTTLKLISDRLISVLQQAKEFAGKKCVVAVSYGITGWEGYAREAAVNLARFFHLDVVGTMLVHAASPGEVVKTEVLDQARRLASALVTGEQEATRLPVHACQLCGNTLLKLMPTGEVKCPMCGADGKIEVNEREFTVQFAIPRHNRFSPEGMTEHGKTLEAIKNQYIAERHELNKLRKPYQHYNWWIKPESNEKN
ncbi:hypothetical protein SRRS_14170 [Sporomusa rhizae]|uniref:flavodoxin family protein n=1 Tax=Sporomusa rhizae TaxID=357999 RepID=UPI00352B783D